MPDKGFRTITIAEQVYEKVKVKAGKEHKSISSLATHVLASFIEADEKLSRYTPLIEVIGFEGNAAILRDHKEGRIVDVYLRDKDLSCAYDNSKDCVHVSFCHALPQVRRVIRG